MFPEIYAMNRFARYSKRLAMRKPGVDAPRRDDSRRGFARQMQLTYEAAKSVADAVLAERGVKVPYHIGTMIELPRACIVANELAEFAEFFSFGTNDLTQTTFCYLRDGAEASFIPRYLEKKVLAATPSRSSTASALGAS